MAVIGLPFMLKAGMISRLELKLNYFKMMGGMNLFGSDDDGQAEVFIEDFFLILAPNTSQRQMKDSYLQSSGQKLGLTEQEMAQPYNDGNCFNIFNNNLQLRRKQSFAQQQLPSWEQDIAAMLSQETLKMLKGFKITVKNVHIRYEDDYFAEKHPYSWGIKLNEVQITTAQDIIEHFQSLNDKIPKEQNDEGEDMFKFVSNLNLTGFQFYLNTKSEIFVPSNLWYESIVKKTQIFEYITVDELNRTMIETQQNYLTNRLEEVRLQIGIKLPKDEEEAKATEVKNEINMWVSVSSALEMRLSPAVVSIYYQFIARCDLSYLQRDLNQYRPKLRPLTFVPNKLANQRLVKRKRRLIVRDWFFFAVWYIRLRKIIVNQINEAHQVYANPVTNWTYNEQTAPYQVLSLLKQLKDPKIELTQVADQIEQLQTIQENARNRIQPKNVVQKINMKFRLQVRMLSIHTQVYAREFYEGPLFQVDVSGCAFDLHSSLQLHQQTTRKPAYARKEPRFSTEFITQKIEVSTFRPVHEQVQSGKQLGPMKINQSIVVGGATQNQQKYQAPAPRPMTPAIQRCNSQSNLNKKTDVNTLISQLRHKTGAGESLFKAPRPQNNSNHYQSQNFTIAEDWTSPIKGDKRMLVQNIGQKQPHLIKQATPHHLKYKSCAMNTNTDVVENELSARKDQTISGIGKPLIASQHRFGESVQQVQPSINRNGESSYVDESFDLMFMDDLKSSKTNIRTAVYNDSILALKSQGHSESARNSQNMRSQNSTPLGQPNVNIPVGMNRTRQGGITLYKPRQSESQLTQLRLRTNHGRRQSNMASATEVSIGEHHSPNGQEPSKVINSAIRNQNLAANQRPRNGSQSSRLGQLLNGGSFGSQRSNRSTYQHLPTIPHNESPLPSDLLAPSIPIVANNNNSSMQTTQTQIQQDAIACKLEVYQAQPFSCAEQETSLTKQKLLVFQTKQGTNFSLLGKMSADINQCTGSLDSGSLQITYSNQALENVLDLLVATKEQNEFRDTDFLTKLGMTDENESKYPQLIKFNKKIGKLARTEFLQQKQHDDASFEQKVNMVSDYAKNLGINWKISGERVYVSLFQEMKRQRQRNQPSLTVIDHMSKFVSPPLSFSLNKPIQRNDNTANLECLGFYTQCTNDLQNLYQLMSASVQGPIMMFKSSPVMQRGQQMFDEMITQRKEETDRTLWMSVNALKKAKARQLAASRMSKSDLSQITQPQPKANLAPYVESIRSSKYKENEEISQQPPKWRRAASQSSGNGLAPTRRQSDAPPLKTSTTEFLTKQPGKQVMQFSMLRRANSNNGLSSSVWKTGAVEEEDDMPLPAERNSKHNGMCSANMMLEEVPGKGEQRNDSIIEGEISDNMSPLRSANAFDCARSVDFNQQKPRQVFQKKYLKSQEMNSDASGGAQKDEENCYQSFSQPDNNGRSFDKMQPVSMGSAIDVIRPNSIQKSSTSSVMDSDNIDEKVSYRMVEQDEQPHYYERQNEAGSQSLDSDMIQRSPGIVKTHFQDSNKVAKNNVHRVPMFVKKKDFNMPQSHKPVSKKFPVSGLEKQLYKITQMKDRSDVTVSPRPMAQPVKNLSKKPSSKTPIKIERKTFLSQMNWSSPIQDRQ